MKAFLSLLVSLTSITLYAQVHLDDSTYVKPYTPSGPNLNPNNNYSYRGNGTVYVKPKKFNLSSYETTGLDYIAMLKYHSGLISGEEEKKYAIEKFETLVVNNSVPVSVLTQHNNIKRTGWNDAEKVLNAGNVNRMSFGKLFSRSVDDKIYAQPLVVSGLTRNGVTRNVLFVETANNSVYAFDADSGQLIAPLWHKHLTYPGYRVIKSTDIPITGNCQNIIGDMGIIGTPVIDTATNTMYVVARSVSTDSKIFVQYLHALDIRTGAEKPNSPIYITAQVAGAGLGSVSGIITFDQQLQNQRSALLLYKGIVYICWASHCDFGNYHGWAMGYDAKTLKQISVYNTTPKGGRAGIWMSGQGPAVDDNDNIYVTTGNGTVGKNLNPNDTSNRGESLLKLSAALKVKDFFTPKDYQHLNEKDLDYGVNGVLLIPNSSLSLSGSKEGILYVINTKKMIGTTADDSQVLQKLNVNATSTSNTKHLHGTPVYFQDSAGKEHVFAWAENSFLKSFPLNRTTGLFDITKTDSGRVTLPDGMPGAFLSVSSNGKKGGTAILWTSHPFFGDAIDQTRSGILRAFDATDITHELWNSNMFSFRDSIGNFAKFVPPTIVNGKVYMATFSNQVVVYGLNPPPVNNCNPIPSAWTTTDIGSNIFPGNVCYKNGQFNITASGENGISSTADAFRFIYKNQSVGDGEIITRVVGIDNIDPWCQAGVMFRENLLPGSREVFLGITNSNGIVFARRSVSNGITDTTNVRGFSPPYWLKLVKQGTQYSAFISPNNITWTKVGKTIGLGFGSAPLFVGVAHTARTSKNTSNSTVDNISITSGTSVAKIAFSAKNVNAQKVYLNWTITNELNVDHYEIEHSTDGVHFAQSITVPGRKRNLKTAYSTFDYNPLPGINYYRLKWFDKNGKYMYSNTIPVSITKKTFVVYPNPASTILNILVSKEKVMQISIFSITGDLLKTTYLSSEARTIINISTLAVGEYMLEVKTEKNVYRTAFLKVTH